MNHVVLLGDSVFDNAAYVAGGPDVIRQLRDRLPGGRATLRAVDGAVIADVARQLQQIPADATHLVISAGGNDALRASGILQEGARSVAEVLDRIADIGDHLEQDYQAMLGMVLQRRLPTALCTIYDPRYPDIGMRRRARTALAVLNDRILRAAFSRGLPLIDLRLVCDRDEDFANPIEPSVRGGEKIAAAIARLVATHDFAQGRSGVFT
jgi:lysophospholipase L1-like esterase